MTNCRVSSEELTHDTGSMLAWQLSYYRNELKHLAACNDKNPVIQAITMLIKDEVSDTVTEEEAMINCIDWYMDNHLGDVVDMVEGQL